MKKITVDYGKGFERDYNKYNYDSDRRKHTPTWDEYKQALSDNLEDSRLYYIMRLGHELGLSPLAVANLKKAFFNTMQPKSIFVETAKAIKRSKNHPAVMRSRLLPINDSLYVGLKDYTKTHQSTYLIPKKKGSGPLSVVYICNMYKEKGIRWTPHRARVFFKSQMKAVLIPAKMYDEGEVRKMMGHQPRDSGERYDDLNIDLDRIYVNEVFAKRL